MQQTIRRQVWKYRLKLVDEQVITVPAGSVVMHVGEQENYLKSRQICMWTMVPVVPPTEPSSSVKWKIYVRGTGVDLPDRACFLGTVICEDGFVWHIFKSVDDDYRADPS